MDTMHSYTVIPSYNAEFMTTWVAPDHQCTSDAIWLDLPAYNMPQPPRNYMLGLHNVLTHCRAHDKPLVMLTRPAKCNRAFVNNTQWKHFMVINNAHYDVHCSCKHGLDNGYHTKFYIISHKSVGNAWDCGKSSMPMPRGMYDTFKDHFRSSMSAVYLTTGHQSMPLGSRSDFLAFNTKSVSRTRVPSKFSYWQRDAMQTDAIGTSQRIPDSPCVPAEHVETRLGAPPGLEGVERTTGDILSPSGTIHVHAYPTASRERRKAAEKAAKEAGTPLVVTKQKKFIEDHHDDCGEDLSSLKFDEGEPTDELFTDTFLINPDFEDLSTYVSDPEDYIEDGISATMLYGRINTVGKIPKVFIARDFEELHRAITSSGQGDDIAEICGDTTVAQFGVRRIYHSKQKLDFVTRINLDSQKDQTKVYGYFVHNKVLVAVLAPSTGGAMEFCGWIADLQLKKQLDFICDSASPRFKPLGLFVSQPWPQLLRDPSVAQVYYHRCMCDLRVTGGSQTGSYYKIAQSVVVSCPELGIPFTNRLCNNNHKHAYFNDDLRFPNLLKLTHVEASLITDGIREVRERIKRGSSFHSTQAYPVFDPTTVARADTSEAPATGDDHRAPKRVGSPCTGCKNMRARDDWTHNRKIGECCYPFNEPLIPLCDACIHHRKRDKMGGDKGHTGIVGECRWATAPTRAHQARTGKHPRDGRRPASEDITSRMPGTAAGVELGAETEQQMEDDALRNLEPPLGEAPGSQGASSSSSGNLPPEEFPVPRAEWARKLAFKERGPNKAWKSASTGDNPQDWTKFDLSRVLRVFRIGDEPQCKLALRKLHLRWWHAQVQPMQRLLTTAGVKKEVIDMIPPIVETCVACRAWTRALPDAQASVELADSFNAQVECDLEFYKKQIIFNLVDRCTRWHHTKQVEGKTEGDCIEAVDSWVSIFGPMKELVVDGETAITQGTAFKAYADRKGILIRPRAPGQHARIVERRGALLRDALHRMDSQLEIEGIQVPFGERLSECTYSGNALVSVNGATPYNAVLGRTPHMLPDLEIIDESGQLCPITNRQTDRVREIAVQAIMSGTAKARLSTAWNTRTLPAGEHQDLKVGDEVDFNRPQGQQDISRWIGPATVTELSLKEGIIQVQHKGRPMPCKVGDVRRHLGYFSYLSNIQIRDAPASVWSYIRNFVDTMAPHSQVLIGMIYNKGTWSVTKTTSTHSILLDACRYFAENCLHRTNPVAFCIGHGCGSYKARPGYHSSLLMMWSNQRSTKHYEEIQCSDAGVTSYDAQHNNPDDWHKLRVLQSLETSENINVVVKGDPLEIEHSVLPSEPLGGTLSPIAEGSHEDDSYESDEIFFNNDPELKEALAYATHCCMTEPDSSHEESDHLVSTFDDGAGQYTDSNLETSSNYHVVAANLRAGLPIDCQLQDDSGYSEVIFEGDTWKLLDDVPRPPGEGEVIALHIYHVEAAKRAVVVKSDDTLTKAEEITHRTEVIAAMVSELQTWAKFQCFSRKLRKDARNIIDCRWVLKWKWEIAATSVADSTTKQESRRVIRARLTVRGFKDLEKHLVEKYAGTSQRFSQRILVSEAVIRKWDIATTDISKAFLQGVTYKELSDMTGEPMREVNFYLPSANVGLLQQVDGFQGFNPAVEVLHCDKPGTGSVDAPRCFAMKLNVVTQKCGLRSSSIDQEFCMLHKNGELILLMTKHVDDLKLAGDRKLIEWIINQLQEVFGNLKILWHEFTNCGVRHIQDIRTKECTLDQIEYAKNLRTITHVELNNKDTSAECGPELHTLYMSLLGAAAYLYLTRLDVLVFISACQRHAHKPSLIHVKRLNVIVRWIQKNPKKIAYLSMTGPAHLRVIGDAAFKKEEEKGHSLRGALFLRAQGSDDSTYHADGPVHVYEYMTKALRHVTRSTFASELLSACDCADMGFLINIILHELAHGEIDKTYARGMREGINRFAINMVLQIDALSVFAAVTATQTKAPAEKGLICHVQWLREMLDTKVIECLMWIDTRDMLADGMTKGAVEREELHKLMAGYQSFKYEHKMWSSKKPISTCL